MATSFDYDINSPSDNHVYDDEELALQLLAEELAFHSPSGNNWREGVPYAESPQAQSMACITQRDLELARMLQTREDEQSMFASSTENSRTDLELAKILQVDADEEMVVESAAEDKKSDLELAMLLQQQEDITANDFLIARQLQDQLEEEGAKSCQRCGQQSCQGHCGRRRRDEEANDRDPPDYGSSRDSLIHQVVQSAFPLRGGGRFFQRTNREEDDEDEDYESLLELGETIGEARPQGLEQEEMNALPTCHFHSNSQSAPTTHVDNDSDSNNCHICFCTFSDNEVLRTLPCLHRFHRDCIDQWIQRKAVCPICRVAIRDHIDGSSNN